MYFTMVQKSWIGNPLVLLNKLLSVPDLNILYRKLAQIGIVVVANGFIPSCIINISNASPMFLFITWYCLKYDHNLYMT